MAGLAKQLRFEILVCNEYLAEELCLKCYPFQSVAIEVGLFLVSTSRTQFVCIVVRCTIGNCAVAVLEVESFFLLTHVLVPYDIERLGLR